MRATIILAIGLTAAMAAMSGASDSTPMTYGETRDAFYTSYHLEKAQSYDDAIKALDELRKRTPDDYTLNLRLGWLYYLTGNYANSRKHYQSAIKASPNAIEPRLGYTLVLAVQEKYNDLETASREIIRIDASNYYANLRLGFSLRMQKKFTQADEVLQRMVDLYPTDTKFLIELALSKVGQQQAEPAKKLFRQILLLDSENQTAKDQLNRL
jgi:tetratricopeptide (TPR) repeat protein